MVAIIRVVSVNTNTISEFRYFIEKNLILQYYKRPFIILSSFSLSSRVSHFTAEIKTEELRTS